MSTLKKISLGVVAILLVVVGVVFTFPFGFAAYDRWQIKSNGELVVGKLVEIKPIEQEAFAQMGENVAPEGSKYVPKAGLVTYIVGGKTYDIIRKELPPDAKIGHTFRVIYLPSAPQASIFEDSSFPYGFMVMSVSLLLACIASAAILLRVGGWRGPKSPTSPHVEFEEKFF